jgi:hypothetical protein
VRNVSQVITANEFNPHCFAAALGSQPPDEEFIDAYSQFITNLHAMPTLVKPSVRCMYAAALMVFVHTRTQEVDESPSAISVNILSCHVRTDCQARTMNGAPAQSTLERVETRNKDGT